MRLERVSWHTLALVELHGLVWSLVLQLYRSDICQVQQRNRYRGSTLRRYAGNADCMRRTGKYLVRRLVGCV